MKVAVLGLGSIGLRHAKNLMALGADLVVHDTDPARINRMGAAVQVAATLRDVWSARPDVVIVCTPTSQHVAHATRALSAGCHVFIEKPISHSLQGVAELEELAESASRRVMVACNMRFHPGPAAVKGWLGNKKIGAVISARIFTSSYLPNWHPDADYRTSYSAHPRHGGAILDTIHELDLATWFLGPARVSAASVIPAASLGLETDGGAEAILHHDSGAITSLHLDFLARDYHRGCRIIGTGGTIEWSWRSGTAWLLDAQGERTEIRHGNGVDEMYMAQFRTLFNCLDRGSAPPNGPAEARATLDMALTIRNWQS